MLEKWRKIRKYRNIIILSNFTVQSNFIVIDGNMVLFTNLNTPISKNIVSKTNFQNLEKLEIRIILRYFRILRHFSNMAAKVLKIRFRINVFRIRRVQISK